MTNAKQTVLANESLFQRACAEWVNRNIGHCVSNLMYDIGKNLEASAEVFDFDPDEARGWFEVPDNEEAVRQFILHDADFDQLEEAAEIAGYWDDALEQANVPSPLKEEKAKVEAEVERLGAAWVECEDPEQSKMLMADRDALQDQLDELDDLEAYVNSQGKMKALRQAVLDLYTEPDEYARAVSEFDLEPDYSEIYEHWVVNSGWAEEELKAQGQVVFDFCGLTIWGRQTTGQSIALDHCIRSHLRSLPDDHYIWKHSL